MSSIVARAGGTIVDDASTQKKTEVMRARLEQREKERLSLNPRERAIGIDKQAIASQMAEKNARLKNQYDDEEENARQEQRLRHHVEQLELRQHKIRRAEAVEMAKEWQTQHEDHLRRYGKPNVEDDPQIDPEACGSSAAQAFQGEDSSFKDRKRLQANQMQEWIYQQTQEKQALDEDKRLDEERKDAYASQIKKIADEIENEVNDVRAHSNASLAASNQHSAATRRAREKAQYDEEQALDAKHLEMQTNNPLLTENRSQAFNVNGRFRRDHFKGMSQEDRDRANQLNRTLVNTRIQQKQREDEDEYQQAQEQATLLRRVDQLELAETRRKEQALKDLNACHEKQRKDAREREEKSRQDSRGAIDNTFFQKFGRSLR